MRSTSTSSTRTFITPAVPSDESEKSLKPKRRLSIGKYLPLLIIVVLIAVSGFFYIQYRDAQRKLRADTPTAANQQVSDLITKVQKLIIVPTNETPTVATVSNADKLKSQSFFAAAQNGDKLLVYSKEKEAILYRPSTNQLVNVAPVNVNASTGLSGQ